jgi:mannose-6-phosphate isomerase-like protein (cupin superfamily)
MPVFRSGEGQAPGWSELEMFETVEVPSGKTISVPFRGPKERYVCIRGEVAARVDGKEEPMREEGTLDIPARAEIVFSSAAGGAVMRLCGHWGEETGGTGIFHVRISGRPGNPGDPADYPRNASFDNHYHDCDEHWILISGSGVAVSEGVSYDVGAGDCVATGRGHHHDFPVAHETVAAVYFETTLSGQKRLGHLWNHRHGSASPDMERV